MRRIRSSLLRPAALAVMGAGCVLAAQAGTAQPAADAREARRAPAAPAKAAPPVLVRTTAPIETVKADPPPARPRKSELKVTLSADGQTVYVVGMIMDGAFHQFDAVLRAAPRARTVHLSSAGGLTIEARLMAALVRKRKLDTYVEFYCASACTQVFAAGRQRTIGPAAQLGFHQAVLLDDRGGPSRVRPRTDRKLTSTKVFGVNGNDTLRLAYELAGIEPAFIDKALNYSPENMWLPGPDELMAARVITRQTPKSELPPAPGGGGSREVVRSHLLQSPLWRAALARLPEATEAAIDEVWRTSNIGLTLEQAAALGRSELIDTATRSLGRAPDEILERSLSLYGRAAVDQRQRGYPACRQKADGDGANIEKDLTFEAEEDALLADFLMSQQRQTPMDRAEATRYFSREVVPKLVGAYRLNRTSGKESNCRLGFQTFEAIDGLPPKKRIKAYRALLSLPGLAGDE